MPPFDTQTGDVVAEIRRLTRALAEMTGQRDFQKNGDIFLEGSSVKFACIRAFDGELSVRARCEALDVTEQGYHAYVRRLGGNSKWQVADAEHRPHIVAAHEVGPRKPVRHTLM